VEPFKLLVISLAIPSLSRKEQREQEAWEESLSFSCLKALYGGHLSVLEVTLVLEVLYIRKT
jgi:hypothetical protein